MALRNCSAMPQPTSWPVASRHFVLDPGNATHYSAPVFPGDAMPPTSWTGLIDPMIGRDACGVGFVADIKGVRSREIVDDGLEILRRLSHRAATGADPETGDGAGILIQLPERFFRSEGARLGFTLAPNRRFAIGQVFLPPDAEARAACEAILEQAVAAEGQRVLGWRDVPIDTAHVGKVALSVMPVFRQLYVRMRRVPPSAWERTLYVIRKLAENRIRDS